MAFDKNDFNTIGPGAGRNMVHYYRTDDTSLTVEGAGYFNGLSKIVRAGDVILAATDMDGTPAVKQYVVTSVSAAGVVSVA